MSRETPVSPVLATSDAALRHGSPHVSVSDMRVAAAVLFLALGACSREPGPQIPTALKGPPPTREEIWAAILPRAERYRLEPAFVYALVAAESNFDPLARNGSARGLMQIKPAAWRTVSTLSYDPNVWDWRANLAVGIDYLAHCRNVLHRRRKFSYPLMLASFHYGLQHVHARGYNLRRIAVPKNELYRQLWAGDLSPLEPPRRIDQPVASGQ